MTTKPDEGRLGPETKALPPLPNADKYSKIITRFAPNPDFVLHLGSIRAVILSHDYARKYSGRFLLRFDDTDPRLKKSALEYYKAIEEDLRWLECPWDQEFIESDRFQIYYEYAEKLLGQGDGYVCTCAREQFHTTIVAGQACPHRSKSPSENLTDWRRMLDGGLGEGEAVVRVKTDITHPNPAVRDWPALRVIDTGEHPHPRVGSKYRVWPLYNFSSGIDDHLMSISHIFRGKEHLTNALRQGYLYKHLGWTYPEAIHYGRLKAIDFSLSKSLMVKQLEEGLVTSYSDPRLPTLAALRRRGYSPRSLRKIVYEMGARPVDATLSWDNINATDRKEIDREAHRYNFIPDPFRLEISGLPGDFEAHLPVHPGRPELGARVLMVPSREGKALVWLSGNDRSILEQSKVVRLMELFNVQVESAVEGAIAAKYHSREYVDARKLRAPLIQWLPDSQNAHFETLMPDGNKVAGLVEENVLVEPVGSLVQMVRIGFGRIDSKESSSITVYFSHK